MNLENVIFIHNGILLNPEEECNLVIHKSMDGTQNIILSEVSQTQKNKTRMFSLIYRL
jgi:hypothetical protein